MKTRTFISAIALACSVMASAQVVIDIDATQRGPKISPTHYGIFYEDINHAADGGLYAELIRNRSFEDDMMPGRRGRRPGQRQSQVPANVRPNRITAWSTVGNAEINLEKDGLLNAVQHNALNVNLSTPGSGVPNKRGTAAGQCKSESET